MNDDEFMVNSKLTCEYIKEYNEKLRKNLLPVAPSHELKPGYLQSLLPERAPDQGEHFKDVIKDLDKLIMPGVTQWHHPDFYGYYPTAKTYESLLGDMISGAIASIGFSWISCPASTELEVIMIDWLVMAMNLPDFYLSKSTSGGGIIQTSASISSAMVILGLRSRQFRDNLVPENVQGQFADRLVVYFSEEAHSSVERACRIALVQLRAIQTRNSGNHGMDVEKLKEQILLDLKAGLIPLAVVGALGTTGSCAFDDLEEIGKLCREMNIWLHVDAAYFGCGLFCPEYHYLAKGIEYADSFNFNLHKIGLVIFDCSILLMRDKSVLVDSFIVNPQYLNNDNSLMPEYRHWDINLGRRFRSLKIWFVLRCYGVSGCQKAIRKHTMLAGKFAELIRKDNSFEIVNQVDFGLVCFRAKGSDDLNRKLYEMIEKERRIFLVTSSYKTHEKVDEKFFLRLTPSCATEEENISFAFQYIKSLLELIKS